jgi:predicted AAA+ superfamily ATPase
MKRINKNILKQVIIENRDFIRKIPEIFIERECFRLPEKVKKVIIFHGVRRSGKTYLLYHLMREKPDNSLYIDFEDERLEGFSLEDFETLREAFYELFPGLIQGKVYFLFDEIQEEDEFVIEDINIKVVPAWKWLLNSQFNQLLAGR